MNLEELGDIRERTARMTSIDNPTSEGGEERALAAPPTGTFALRAGLALLPGRGLVKDVTVVVEGGTITDVIEAGRLPEAAESRVFNASGSTLLPGLIDSHVHLTFSGGPDPVGDYLGVTDVDLAVRAYHNSLVALARGVTTVVDCGARGGVALRLRELVCHDAVPGPRILATGAPITTTAGHCAWLGACADSLDEVIREARRQVAAGADLLKVMLTGGNLTPGSNPAMLQYPPEVVLALGAESRRLGRALVAHAHSEEAVALAARAGVGIVSHATCRSANGIAISDADVGCPECCWYRRRRHHYRRHAGRAGAGAGRWGGPGAGAHGHAASVQNDAPFGRAPARWHRWRGDERCPRRSGPRRLGASSRGGP